MTESWIDVCGVEDIDAEDVIPFDHAAHTYAVYRSQDGARFYATDGLCTHEHVHLADGLVMGEIIECPKHNGRFNFTTGVGKGVPICENLRPYPVRVANGVVQLQVSAA